MSSMDLDKMDPTPIKPRRPASRFLKPSKNLKPAVPGPNGGGHAKEEEAVQKHEDLDDVKPILAVAGINGDHASGTSTDTATDMEVDDKEMAENPVNADAVVEEEEDCVVREIDVFFNASVGANDKVYVTQYPLRPRWRPYEVVEYCQEVRVKPKTIELEIDLSLNAKSKNFDSDWEVKSRGAHYGEEWAKSVKLDRQTLVSSGEPPKASYAIGIIANNKLHLNPIHSVLQLRPSLKHLQYGEPVSKKDIKSDVLVKSEELNGRESSRLSKDQTKLKGVVNTTEKEGWIPLMYHNPKSEYSVQCKEKLTTDESCPILFPVTRNDYINSICPGTSDNISDKGGSKRFLLTLPLDQRLKKWLCEGDSQVHRFNTLKHLAPDVPDKDLIELIRQYSVLLQGLWVRKSEYSSDHNVTKSLRDYVLYLFSINQTVSYSQINKLKAAIKTLKLGGKINFIEVVDRLLKTLAVERKDLNDWKFKEPADESFVKSNPDLVAEYERKWEITRGKLEKILFSGVK